MFFFLPNKTQFLYFFTYYGSMKTDHPVFSGVGVFLPHNGPTEKMWQLWWQWYEWRPGYCLWCQQEHLSWRRQGTARLHFLLKKQIKVLQRSKTFNLTFFLPYKKSAGYFVHHFAPSNLPRIPKNVIFVIDQSGSMHGRKIEQVQFLASYGRATM